MKPLIALIVLACSISTSFGQETTIKTRRMKQIEDKFHMSVVFVYTEDDGTYWAFKSIQNAGLLGYVPVMVKSDATDKEVAAAQRSSEACVKAYDDVIKKAVKKAQEKASEKAEESFDAIQITS